MFCHGQGGTNHRLLVTRALVTWLSHAALTVLPALNRQSKRDKKATPVVCVDVDPRDVSGRGLAGSDSLTDWPSSCLFLDLQIARLRSELDIVRGNTKVMSEMLTEMVPGQEDSSDLELLQVRISLA